jgi:hypothetical protein
MLALDVWFRVLVLVLPMDFAAPVVMSAVPSEVLLLEAELAETTSPKMSLPAVTELS